MNKQKFLIIDFDPVRIEFLKDSIIKTHEMTLGISTTNRLEVSEIFSLLKIELILVFNQLVSEFIDASLQSELLRTHTPLLIYKMRGNEDIPVEINGQVEFDTISLPFQYSEFQQRIKNLQSLSKLKRKNEEYRQILAIQPVSSSQTLILEKLPVSEIVDSQRIKSLSKIGRDLISSVVLEDIVAILHRDLNNLMPAPIVLVGKISKKTPKEIDYWEYTSDNKKLVLRTAQIDDPNSMSCWCLRNNKKIFLTDFDTEHTRYISDRNIYYSDNQPKSGIYLPLYINQETIGVIIVKNYPANSYSRAHLNMLRNLAVYLSIALYNSELFYLLKIQNDNIKASIRYGLTIQNTILPKKQAIDRYYDNFIIYQPKDIVSGDFYWFSDKLPGNRLIFTVIDCTGHGVPGAFMSMIANMLLNDIINEKKISIPNKILEFLDMNIKQILHQGKNENNDGMDLVMCLLEKQSSAQTKVTFCGAKNDLFYFSKLQITEIKGDRRSIGGKTKRSSIQYQNKEVVLDKGDIVYLLTDGIIDQNAPDRKRFGSHRLIELLSKIGTLSMLEQGKAVEQAINEYKKNEDLRDDITLLGLKV